MGCICQLLYTLFVNVEQFKKKTIGMAIASAVAASVNLLLNWIFIPRYGYLAAAYTTLVGYLCLLCIHMFLVYRLKLSIIYSYKFIACAFAIAFILMIIITMGYNNDIMHYITIMAYCIFALYFPAKNKSNIKKFII